MKILMTGAAALLLSATPALAQKATATTPDNNAKCLIGVTFMASVAADHKGELSGNGADVIATFDKAIYFHAGVLRGRYTDAEMDPVVDAGAKAFFGMPNDKRSDFIMECLKESSPMLNRVADVLSKG